ncbi:MAG: hypothetical protein QM756_27360 [Polyangiaceae bacterium]
MKRFCVALRRVALDRAHIHQPAKRFCTKPTAWLLRRKMAQQVVDFSFGDLCVERHVQVRMPQIAFVFVNFVLADQMIAERVPGELGDRRVVLMRVFAAMREDQIGIYRTLECLEKILNLGCHVGKIAFSKVADLDARFARTFEQRGGARFGFRAPHSRRRQHDPGDVALAFGEQAQNRTAAADLEIITVRAQATNAKWASALANA